MVQYHDKIEELLRSLDKRDSQIVELNRKYALLQQKKRKKKIIIKEVIKEKESSINQSVVVNGKTKKQCCGRQSCIYLCLIAGMII